MLDLSLSFSIGLISQDKGLHCDFACLMYPKLANCLPKACFTNIIISTADINMEFVFDALPMELIGMNSNMMCNNIKYCADRLLGYCRHFKMGNPFEWMETISLQRKTNISEKHDVSKYTKSGGSVSQNNQIFVHDKSF